MKKIILTTLLILLSKGVFANEATTSTTQTFISIENFYSASTLRSDVVGVVDSELAVDVDKYNAGGRITAGASNGNFEWSFFYQKEYFIYDDLDEKDSLNTFGFDLSKNFVIEHSKFSPFIKAGFSIGSAELMSMDKGRVYGFHVGTGVAYAFTSNFKMIAGVDLQYRNFGEETLYIPSGEDVDLDGVEDMNRVSISMSEFSPVWSLGIKYYF